jgi:hypothetical protein
MKRLGLRALLLLALCVALANPSWATYHGSSHSSAGIKSASSHPRTSRSTSHGTKRALTHSRTSRSTSHRTRSALATGSRDSHGRIRRNESAKREFERQTGYPKGRKGYVVDHKTPLACGGADSPSNMQWQTTADAKAKDKVERRGCK